MKSAKAQKILYGLSVNIHKVFCSSLKITFHVCVELSLLTSTSSSSYGCFLIDLLELHNVCEDILQDVLGDSLWIASLSRVGSSQGRDLKKETRAALHLGCFFTIVFLLGDLGIGVSWVWYKMLGWKKVENGDQRSCTEIYS